MKASRSTSFLVKLALSILGYGLLIYAASRTLEFVQATMPPEKQWMGYLYLLATGIGALIWLHVFLHDAHGAKRRGLSMGIAIVDLLMEFVLVYADTVRESSKQGLLQMTGNDLQTFILASVLAVGLNAFAWFFYTLWDPDKEQDRKAADFADDIEEEAMKVLSTPEARKNMIAAHAPHIQAVIMQRVTENVATRFTGIPADPRMPIIPADPRQYEQAIPHTVDWHVEQIEKEELNPTTRAGYPDNYGPMWKNSTHITPTLDAYAWVCPNDHHNPAYTRTCSTCGHPRTNGSPVTADGHEPSYHPVSLEPKPKEAGEQPSPFQGYEPE